MPELATKGQLQPMDTYLKRDAVDLKDFFETGITMYQWQDKQYALPWLAFRALLYNADLLKQHGVAPPPSDWKDKRWTWDAFLTALRRVQAGTGGPGAAAASPGSATWPFNGPGQFLDAWIWVLGNGGDVLSRDERALTLDQPAALEGLQFYADLMARHKVHPSPAAAAQDPEQATFTSGRAAFYLGAVNTVGRLQNATFTCHAAPVPWGKAGTSVTGGGHSWPMNNASTEKDAAWELQKFLASKENDLAQVLSGEAPPFRKSTAQLKEWKERTPPANPETLAESAAYLRPQPKVPTWNEINRELNNGLKPAFEGERSARDVVQSLKPRLTQLLEQGWREIGR